MRGVSGAYWTDPWKPVKGGEGLYYGVFDTSMPDWNLRNPKVVAYLKDSMRFWLNKGVDGLRLDAVTMLLEDGKASYFNNPGNAALIMDLRKAMDEYDNRYLICEASEGRELYLEACSAFAYGVQQHLIDGIKKGVVAKEVITLLQDPKLDLAPLALQSHDSYVGDRLINQFGVNGGDNYRVAAAIATLVSATPFAYYGEEIGMSNGGVHNDPGLRSPMSWTGDTKTTGFTTGKPYRDVAINVAGNNVAAQENDPDSLLAYYTSLYKVRQTYPVIATGAFTLLSKAGDPYLAFSRTDKRQQAVVIANVSAEPQTVMVDAKGAYQYALGGQGALMPTGGKLSVPVAPKATVVLMSESALPK
jgi:alpha-amylase